MGRAEYIYDDDVPMNLSDYKNSNSNQRKASPLSIINTNNFKHSLLFFSSISIFLIRFAIISVIEFFSWIFVVALASVCLVSYFIFVLFIHLFTAGGTPLCYLGLEHVNKTQRRSRFNYLEKAIKIYNWIVSRRDEMWQQKFKHYVKPIEKWKILFRYALKKNNNNNKQTNNKSTFSEGLEYRKPKITTTSSTTTTTATK